VPLANHMSDDVASRKPFQTTTIYTSATPYLPPQNSIHSDYNSEVIITSWNLDLRNNSRRRHGLNHAAGAALSHRGGTAVSRAPASASSPPTSNPKRQVEECNMVITNKIFDSDDRRARINRKLDKS
jgi:hypothetical protein